MEELQYSRRNFLEFVGKSAAAAGTLSLLPSSLLGGLKKPLPIQKIGPSRLDRILLSPDLHSSILIRSGEPLSSKMSFGYNNDFIAFLPSSNPNEGFLWVNHEYPIPLFVSGYGRIDQELGKLKTKAQVDLERKVCGGSFFKIKKKGSQWKVDASAKQNFQIDSTTPILFDQKIRGASHSVGMIANCSGGVTPWGTLLTCEENYHKFYGERLRKTGKFKAPKKKGFQWYLHYPHAPEHYGWVVEVDPIKKTAIKRTALGRFQHESATVVPLPNKRVAIYSGHDDEDSCVYKFVSSEPNSLSKGTLFVANLNTGKWIPLVWDQHATLKKTFKNQLDVLVHTHEAAQLIGGTPLDRPESIAIHPQSGDVVIALTGNYKAKRYFGSLLKIEEKNADHGGTSFGSHKLLAGGPDSGFSCPDNLAFDRKGNLWFTTDISGKYINKAPFREFQNNGLFVIPVKGSHAGQAIQVASAPVEAEFTGPCFSADGKTLFLSVQHPGERSKTRDQLTSHWPKGKPHLPSPAVIQISGPGIDKLVS